MPTVLLVDDEQGFRYSFRRVFAEEGRDILTAATVAEGIQPDSWSDASVC